MASRSSGLRTPLTTFARLETNVGKIVRILAQHGHAIDEGMGYAVLPEFWKWFHDHLLGYHASTIAEHLNNIRWGIYHYLQREFSRSNHRTGRASGLALYSYRYPAGVDALIARTMYWDLMNFVRSEPYFPRFTVTASLKSQF